MPKVKTRGVPTALGLALLFVSVSAPAPAYAHGIGGDASDASVFGFIELGITHMLTGWDHLAFVAGVLLVAQSFGLSVKLISIFVLGHSTTLIAATLLGWQVNADYVDAVIAGSVAFVGCVGILGRPRRWGWFGIVVADFGLVHGLGLATRFADLGLPENGRLLKVIAFNIGIEVGQATAIFAMFVVGSLLASFLVRPTTGANDSGPPTGAVIDEDGDMGVDAPRSREQLATQLASAALFIGGSVTGALVALNAFMAEPGPEPVRLADGTSCTIEALSETLPGSGGHPKRSFYSPGEVIPVNDFGHSLGDGYVVVLYSPDIDSADLAKLRDYVASSDARGVVAGAVTSKGADRIPSDGLDPATAVKVLHQQDELTCGTFELDSIEAFADAWLRPAG